MSRGLAAQRSSTVMLAAALAKQLERLEARTDGDVSRDVPRALAHVAVVRFGGELVLRDATMIDHAPLRWAPFAVRADDDAPFFAKHLVFGLARSDSAALWALARGPAEDPLVFLRDDDEDEDDFDAIEAEGRAWRPLSELLAGAVVHLG